MTPATTSLLRREQQVTGPLRWEHNDPRHNAAVSESDLQVRDVVTASAAALDDEIVMITWSVLL
jgi:hypothetical protein